MVVVVALLGFLVGVAVGAAFVARNAHRIVARLDPPERAAFARKVTAAVRHR